MDGKIRKELLKQKILNCIRAWEDWTIYPFDYLINLQNKFLELHDLDGVPLEDETVIEEKKGLIKLVHLKLNAMVFNIYFLKKKP